MVQCAAMDGVPPTETTSQGNKTSGPEGKKVPEDETEAADSRVQSGNGASSSNQNG